MGGDERNDSPRQLLLTGLITRVLSAPATESKTSKSILKSVTFLRSKAWEYDEPYVLASLALAATTVGDQSAADWALDRLERIAQREGDTAFWKLEANTPFYSWGLPGRLETTALAVRALAAGRPRSPWIESPLLFLLKNKDAFGVRHSNLYDYYNPEASVFVPLTSFVVR